MILASSSLSMPGFTSTSTPRSLKMATAAGESLSEMSTRGMGTSFKRPLRPSPLRGRLHREVMTDQRSRAKRKLQPGTRGASLPREGEGRRSSRFGELGFFLAEGEIEPWRQRLEIGCLDGSAAPDTQAWRRVAVRTNIERDLFFFEEARESFGESRLRIG